MKRFFPALAIPALCLVLPLGAQTAERPLTVRATGSYVTEYMYRGTQLAGSSFEPEIEANAGQAVFGVWSNVALEKTALNPTLVTEVVPYATYSFFFTKEFSIAPGFAAYTYSQSTAAQGFYRSRYEPNLSLNYNLSGVLFTPTAYYDLTLRELTLELTVSTALPLSALGTELDLTGTVGHASATDALNRPGPREKSWGSYWLLGGTIPYQLRPNLKAALGYAYTEGFDAHTQLGNGPTLVNPRAVGRSVITVSLTVTF